MEENEITERIIGAAIEVHKVLGPGLLESAYEETLCFELSQRGIGFERQKGLPLQYKTIKLDCGFRLELLVENKVIVEVKAIETLPEVHLAQLLTYLRLLDLRIGLLINVNVPKLTDGIKRVANNYRGPNRK